MLSTSDLKNKAGSLIYVFVSLQGQSIAGADFFVMSGIDVSNRLKLKYAAKDRKSSIRMLNIFDHEKDDFLNRWDIIEAALNQKEG